MRTRSVLLTCALAMVGLVTPSAPVAAAPEDAEWSADLASPIHLYDPSLTELADGRVFVVGQRLTPDSPPFANFTQNGNAAIFDPADDSWTRVADPAHARVGEAVTLPDGRVAAIGGSGMAASSNDCPHGAGEVYDPGTDEWTPIPTVAGLQCGGVISTAVLLPDGRVLIHAGIGAVWDPSTDTTTALSGPGPIRVRGMVVAGGKVFATAGWNETNNRSVISRFDPSTASWTRGDVEVEITDTKRQNLHVIDEDTLFVAGQTTAALVDTDTLAVTPLPAPGTRNICGAGVLGDGAPFVLGCGGQDTVSERLDRTSLTWQPLPNDVPERHSAYVRTLTVPSGTYVAGLRIGIDGFDFARYAEPSGPVNTAPIAFDQRRTVGHSTEAVLRFGALDPDGDALTYTVIEGPFRGVLSGTGPTRTYQVPPGTSGPDLVRFRVEDGRGGVDEGRIDITITDPSSLDLGTEADVPAGGTVTTGGAEVVTPNAGTVSIQEVPDPDQIAGYGVLGTTFHVSAPDASVGQPLQLTFRVDSSQIPAGVDPVSITAFRDGIAVADCADDSGTATPDPCVAERIVTAQHVTLRILSSHASVWMLATPLRATTTVLDQVAPSAYGQQVTLRATVAQGTGIPAGVVRFRDLSTGTTLGEATLDAGAATLPGLVLDAGTHALVADYLGGGLSAPSTSAERSVVVTKAPITFTVPKVSIGNGLRAGRFTFTARVASAITGAPVAGVPVQFRTRLLTGQYIGCTAFTGVDGIATCTSAHGYHLIAAYFPGSFEVLAAESANHRAGAATGRYGG